MTTTSKTVTLYVIECDGIAEFRPGYTEPTGTFRVVIPVTGEIRESATLTPLLKSIVRDHGYYLRKR